MTNSNPKTSSIFLQSYCVESFNPGSSSNYNTESDPELIGEHSIQGLRVIGVKPLSLGYYGLVIIDPKEYFHAIVLGGSNALDSALNMVCLHLYKFDQPNGPINEMESTVNFRMMDFSSDMPHAISTGLSNILNRWLDNQKPMKELIAEVRKLAEG